MEPRNLQSEQETIDRVGGRPVLFLIRPRVLHGRLERAGRLDVGSAAAYGDEPMPEAGAWVAGAPVAGARSSRVGPFVHIQEGDAMGGRERNNGLERGVPGKDDREEGHLHRAPPDEECGR
jgi:hypothetical protein